MPLLLNWLHLDRAARKEGPGCTDEEASAISGAFNRGGLFLTPADYAVEHDIEHGGVYLSNRSPVRDHQRAFCHVESGLCKDGLHQVPVGLRGRYEAVFFALLNTRR